TYDGDNGYKDARKATETLKKDGIETIAGALAQGWKDGAGNKTTWLSERSDVTPLPTDPDQATLTGDDTPVLLLAEPNSTLKLPSELSFKLLPPTCDDITFARWWQPEDEAETPEAM